MSRHCVNSADREGRTWNYRDDKVSFQRVCTVGSYSPPDLVVDSMPSARDYVPGNRYGLVIGCRPDNQPGNGPTTRALALYEGLLCACNHMCARGRKNTRGLQTDVLASGRNDERMRAFACRSLHLGAAGAGDLSRHVGILARHFWPHWRRELPMGMDWADCTTAQADGTPHLGGRHLPIQPRQRDKMWGASGRSGGHVEVWAMWTIPGARWERLFS